MRAPILIAMCDTDDGCPLFISSTSNGTPPMRCLQERTQSRPASPQPSLGSLLTSTSQSRSRRRHGVIERPIRVSKSLLQDIRRSCPITVFYTNLLIRGIFLLPSIPLLSRNLYHSL